MFRAMVFLPPFIKPLMNLLASRESNRGSGLSCFRLAVIRPIFSLSRVTFVLWFFHPVATPRLSSPIDSQCIERSPDYLVTDSWQIPDPSTPNEYDRVFLEVVTFPGDVNGRLFPVGKSYTSDFSQGRIWFLGCHRPHLQADSLFLRAAIQHGSLGLLSLLLASLANQLVNCWH